MSVYPEQRGSPWTDFYEILYRKFLTKICWAIFNVGYNWIKVTGALHEKVRKYVMICR
jgi:hypothetical protein